MFSFVLGRIVIRFAQLITGVRAIWLTNNLRQTPRVYFANHASHGDFVLVWSSLPYRFRKRTRPVAAAEYWQDNIFKRYVITSVFNGVLVERDAEFRTKDPIVQMANALAEGGSLIVFPEGTRNTTEEVLLPFKSGIFHLATQKQDVEFIPVWISNLNRVMPKGRKIPLPILSTVTFGASIFLQPGEDKAAFLKRCSDALLHLQTLVD